MSQLIAAISTPPGPGGVGILRLSGPGAIGAASQAFRPRGKVPLAQAPDRQLLYGAVLDRDGRTNVATQPGGYQTSVDRVFTAGDMHRGQSLVVWAIAEWRDAARAVDDSLMGYSNL